MSKPVGLSKSSAGPPPGDLHARSVTAAISRSGLTGSAIRASSRLRSRSERKSVRSAYIGSQATSSFFVVSWFRGFVTRGGHFIDNLLRERERAAAVFAGHRRRTPRRDRIHEVRELARQRFFVDHRDFPAGDTHSRYSVNRRRLV